MKRNLSLRAAAATLALGVSGCLDHKVAETSVPAPRGAGPAFGMVQVERVPQGIEYVVYCTSFATRSSPGRSSDFVPAGSTYVGRLSGGLPMAGALEQAKTSLAGGRNWVAWMQDPFRITFDACASWVDFEPWKFLQPAEVRDGGRGCGSEACARSVLIASRPQLREASAERASESAPRRIRFVMQSAALVPTVREGISEDDGRTWRFAPLPEDPRVASFEPDPMRYLTPPPGKKSP
jgi:hypothetical protein